MMVGAIKRIAWIIAETLIFIGILGITYGIIGGLMIYLQIVEVGDFQSTSIDNPYSVLLLDYIPVFIGAIAGVVIVHQLIFKRQIAFSGLGLKGWVKQLAIGFLWSAVLLTAGYIILTLLNFLKVENVEMHFSLFFGFFLFFFVQSSFEELAMRSFLLPTIAHRTNIWVAVLISSVVFTFLHFDNSNVNYLSLFNIFLAGILLGTLYISYGKVWAPIGLHMGWNFLQGSFYGFEVSGIDVYSYIDTKETGPDFWTGGAFGFEGSFIATILLASLSIALLWKSKDRFKEAYFPIPTNSNLT